MTIFSFEIRSRSDLHVRFSLCETRSPLLRRFPDCRQLRSLACREPICLLLHWTRHWHCQTIGPLEDYPLSSEIHRNARSNFEGLPSLVSRHPERSEDEDLAQSDMRILQGVLSLRHFTKRKLSRWSGEGCDHDPSRPPLTEVSNRTDRTVMRNSLRQPSGCRTKAEVFRITSDDCGCWSAYHVAPSFSLIYG